MSPSISSSGGPADHAPIVTSTLPSGETYSAAGSGTGWGCVLSSSNTVDTCTYSGSLPISAGAALGTISATVDVGSSASGSLTTNTTMTDSADGATQASATATVDATARPSAPSTPVVTGISPSSGPTSGGTVVTITGTNLDGATVVDFGPNEASNITVVSSTEIQVTAPPGSAGTVDITVVTPGGTSSASSADRYTYVAVKSGAAYHPLTPARLCDTRKFEVANPCTGHTLGADGTLTIQVTGMGGVPTSGVSAVVVNVTAADPTTGGYLTVYPAGQSTPATSSVNYPPSRNTPSLVEVGLSSSGQIAVFNSAGSTNVVVDVEGYIATAPPGYGLYDPLDPFRICDTRTSQPRNQCTGESLGSAGSITMQVSGLGGVPASGVSAVVIQLTAANPSASGWMLAFPTGSSMPLASNVNFVAGHDASNRVIVPLGANGKITVYADTGNPDVVVDVVGWFTDGSNPAALGSLFN
ncbi:MAG: IPT/TIG domain-containing protein, partial [Acidimicrobiales bacterium]